MSTRDELTRNAVKAAQYLGGLISALLDPASRRRNGVLWDPRRARFRAGPSGLVISIARVRRELLKVEARQLALTQQYIGKLYSREWTSSKWKEEMTLLIEESHVMAGALAVGGIPQSTAEEVVTRRIQRDLDALGRFQEDIRTGRTNGLHAARNRGRTYARSPFVTYSLLEQRKHIEAGMRYGRRRLTLSEHCRSKDSIEGCLEAAARGWMLIKQVPPIGTLRCRQFCKCWIQYSNRPQVLTQ